ncbi:MAG: hypothetical protein AAGB93_03490 [Planctomycetota bacterium]
MRCSLALARSHRCALLALGCLAASPHSAAEAETCAGSRLRHSGLAEVRLLDVLDAPGARGVTFATWFMHADGAGEIALFRLGLDDPAGAIPLRAIGEPHAAMRIDPSIVPIGASGDSSRWRLVGHEGARRAVVHDPRNDRIGVLGFPGGEVLHVEEQATTLLDAGARDGALEVLYEREGAVRWLRLDGGAEPTRGLLPIARFEPYTVDAALVASSPGGVGPTAAVAAGRSEGRVVGFVAELGAAGASSFWIDADVAPSGPPVVAAAGGALAGGGRVLAIGQPRGNQGDGRIALLRAEPGGVPAEIGWLAAGTRVAPDPRALDAGFGAWVGLAADADGDGLPELCTVSLTSSGGHRRLEVVRSRGVDGREEFLLQALGGRVAGTSLSLDPSGRFVLVAAGSEQSSGPAVVPAQALLVEIGSPSRVRARLTTATD